MPRCIITGKDTAQKTFQSDSADLNKYFELGWEVTTTFLETYYLRKTGVFSRDDVVVTVPGREFLYGSLFDRVIDYKCYLASKPPYPTLDLVQLTTRRYNVARQYLGWRSLDRKIHQCRLRLHHNQWYRQRYKRVFVKDDIASMVIPDLPNEPYLCICLRRRQHHQERNIPESYCRDLLEALRHRICYVVGLGIEHLVTQPRHRVCSLAEFTTLAASPNCECVLGCMTGTMQLAQLVHSNKLIAIDFGGGHLRWNSTVPCVLSDFANLADVSHHIYTYLPAIKEIVDDLEGRSGSSRIKPENLNKRSYRRMMKVARRRGHSYYEWPTPEFQDSSSIGLSLAGMQH